MTLRDRLYCVLTEGLTDQEKQDRRIRAGLLNQVWKVVERELDKAPASYSVTGVKKAKIKSGYSIGFTVKSRRKNLTKDDVEQELKGLASALRRADISDAKLKFTDSDSGVVVRLIIPNEVLAQKGVSGVVTENDGELEGSVSVDADSYYALKDFADRHAHCECGCCASIVSLIRACHTVG